MGLFDLDMNTPQGQGFNQALLAAAQALLTPRSKGGGMGAAFGAFPQAIDRAKANAMREQLMALQGRQVGLQTDKLGFDTEQAKAQQEAARARQAQFAQLVGTLPPEQRMIAEQLGPDYFKGMAPQPVKPTFQKWWENGRERSGFVAPGQAPQPVGDAAPQDMNKFLVQDEKGNWVPNQAYIGARQSVAKAGASNQNVYTGTLVPAEVNGRQAFVMPSKDGSIKVVEGVAPAGTAAAAEKAGLRKKEGVQRADLVIGKIDDALGKVGFFTTGLTGSVLGRIPGREAYDLRADVDTIKANIGFQELQKMRDMSPTGGALGQVAIQELNMLQAVISSLDANQSEAQIKKGLLAARERYSNWKRIISQTETEPAVAEDPLGIR